MINNSPMSMRQAKDSFRFLVSTTIEVMKLKRDEAEKRVAFLFSSGLLNYFNPMEEEGQKKVDQILSIDSSKHAEVQKDINDVNGSLFN